MSELGNSKVDGHRLKWHLRLLWLAVIIDSLPVAIEFIMTL